MASTPEGALPLRELRRRLQQVHAATEHLKTLLPVESPHNQYLRIIDIARYLETDDNWLRHARFDHAPKNCQFACASVNECRAKQNCRSMNASVQRALSRFFRGWDEGLLVKARVGGEWKIVPRNACDPALASLATAPGAQTDARRPPIKLVIDRETLGLKVTR